MTSRRIIYAILFLSLFAAVGYLYKDTRSFVRMPQAEAHTSQPLRGDSVIIIEKTVETVPAQPPGVPEFMVFAGDTIRFNRSDLYERMDRELTAFTFSHTNSILMLKRSGRIFPQIEPLLAENGIPDDLKYMMAIESNVSETAVSVAGAAGLWQFMREVGKEYGLEVDLTVDERYDIRKETLAACTYLKKAYARFGDWMTVAASYNGGINGVAKKREVQKEPLGLDLYLVEETSRYMFRILAAKMMFEDPSLFGFDLSPEDYYPYIPPRETVKVSASIEDLPEFAHRYGVSYAQLRRANPWLRDTKLTAKKGKTYEIAIPDLEAERNYYISLSERH
ncbi:MAG: lytic transglycosylase domain-containing protein [Bacteroidales bacterium]|nr:lytic transglycosylase domain-containing protein [Bacteroidales bacterium]